jgi:alpha-acetolactate decarboxylase
MKNIFLAMVILAIAACERPPKNQEVYKVEHKGALRNFMHKNDISAKANLTDLENIDHLYALGAVEELKGEILIMDGKPYISAQKNGKLEITNNFDEKASLLVYANVLAWQTFEVPENVVSYKDFENYVEKVATENGIDTEKPFPFLLSGTAKSFDWHVINWDSADSVHTHKKHRESGLYGTKTNLKVDILGFYSKHHHAIFTHHTTNMHMHVKTPDDKLSAHLDDLVLGEGMKLQLPFIR